MSVRALQEYTYYSRYARYNESQKRRETWAEAVDRVMNMHLRKYPEAKEEIEWLWPLVKEKRLLGSQRALQFGGVPVEKKNARLYNCSGAYCDRLRFFQEALWMLLCGSGVGFSVQTHHIDKLPPISPRAGQGNQKVFNIPDTIEGWADALGILLGTYMPHPEFPEWEDQTVEFDYSLIRPAGSPLSSGVGKAPGPKPLRRALIKIRTLLDGCVGQKKLRPIDAYDILMHASDAVLSGGVRRSATLCLFSPNDEDMLTAKTGNWRYENPQRGRSNNSALLVRGETTREGFNRLFEVVKECGEPGFIWAEDKEALFNPCCEIGMYGYDEDGNSGWQVCNLCEINGKRIKCKEDFALAARGAAILGTLQAGYSKFDYLGEISERIIRREALLGVSITGMMDSPDIIFDEDTQKEMAKLILSENTRIAKLIGINPAARGTCVKPAGCQKGNTLVSTSEGIFKLSELGNTSGPTWQNLDINAFTDRVQTKASKFFVNGSSKTKKIFLSSGIILESTCNHRYRVLKDGNYIWKQADEIEEEDLLPYSIGEYTGGEYQKLNTIEFNTSKYVTRLKPIKQPFVLDEDLAFVIGLYFADGSNHKKGIRISDNSLERKGFDKTKRIIEEKFGRTCTEDEDKREGNRTSLCFNSTQIVPWLVVNNLSKQPSLKISVPLMIRMSPPSVIQAFIEGYGCQKSERGNSFSTTSQEMAEELVVLMRAIGIDCKMRLMSPTDSSWGNNMRYWIQVKKGRKGEFNKNRRWVKDAWNALDSHNLPHMSVDKVLEICDGECKTYDIEVPDKNTYLSHTYVSHNTTSCVLGSASGVHAHHARLYFRNVQENELSPILQFFKEYNSEAVEPSVWSEGHTDEIITFCVEVPAGAKIKNQLSAIELLEHVKLTQQNWVSNGKRKNLCVQPWLTHNVSNTVSVRPDEWDEVANYIYKNRRYFSGIALVPQSSDLDYPQSPFICVHTPREVLQMYGDGALFASGLIVDGLHVFGENLWIACDVALGLGEPLKDPPKPGNGTTNIEEYREWEAKVAKCQAKRDWIRRAEQFADRYCDGDLRRCTYLMKEVNNWKKWMDLTREYKDVPYTEFIEEENNCKLNETVACAGGACQII